MIHDMGKFNPKYKNSIDCIQKIYKAEGPNGFVRKTALNTLRDI